MSDKFKNKYRIPSTRLRCWNYSWNGSYFITICTHHRQHYFGKITRGKMSLSVIGQWAEFRWYFAWRIAAWQARYHDHIIRNEQSFLRIQHYINTNVENWKEDRFCK